MAPDSLAGIGAAVALIVGAAGKAWRQMKADEARASRARQSLPRSLPVAVEHRCAQEDRLRSVEVHAERAAKHTGEIKELLMVLVRLCDTHSNQIARVETLVDDVREWSRPTTKPGA